MPTYCLDFFGTGLSREGGGRIEDRYLVCLVEQDLLDELNKPDEPDQHLSPVSHVSRAIRCAHREIPQPVSLNHPRTIHLHPALIPKSRHSSLDTQSADGMMLFERDRGCMVFPSDSTSRIF